MHLMFQLSIWQVFTLCDRYSLFRMFFLNFLLGNGFWISPGTGAMGSIGGGDSWFSNPVLFCVDHPSQLSSSLLLLLFLTDFIPVFDNVIECLLPARHSCRGWKYSSLLSGSLSPCEKGEITENNWNDWNGWNRSLWIRPNDKWWESSTGTTVAGLWRPLTSWRKVVLFLPSCALSPWFCPWCLVAWLPSQLSCTQSWSQCHVIPLPPLRDLQDIDGLSFPLVLSLSYFLIH